GADVIGYQAFLSEIDDPEVREETRKKTVEVFRIADRAGCRHQALVRCFDEEIAPCGGSCDRCRGTTIADLVAHAAPERLGAAPGASARAGKLDREAAIVNPELFERLRALRKRLADAESVPAYIVFSDAVLRQMAAQLPRSRAEMLLLSGIGPVKLDRYGEAFLAEIARGSG